MSHGEEMTRDEFVKAMALALAANEEKNQDDSTGSLEVARSTYESLQYDFPQRSASDLKALAAHMRDNALAFPITFMLFRNALELAQRSDVSTSAAAALLIQCYFTPFQTMHVDAFQLQETSSMEAKLLLICYHTTYSPLSSLSLDDWNHLQCTDLCCSTASKLYEWPQTANQEAMLLHMEWIRYMHLLRDRMLQYPVTCAGILNKMVHFFADKMETAQTWLLQLLVEVAASKEFKQASMAKASILSTLRSLLSSIAKQFALLVEKSGVGDILIYAQLLEWAVVEDAAMISALEDYGILRTTIQFVAANPTDSTTLQQTLRLLVQCMLFRTSFAAYMERVPSMQRWRDFAQQYPAEYCLWALSLSLSRVDSSDEFSAVLGGLFPSHCTNAFEAQKAMMAAVYVLETLVKLQHQGRLLTKRNQIIAVLTPLTARLAQLFTFPRRDDVEDDEAATKNTALKNRIRLAVKTLTSVHGAKID
ncbi:unnamed protein product [Aphanomyces euteiches]